MKNHIAIKKHLTIPYELYEVRTGNCQNKNRIPVEILNIRILKKKEKKKKLFGNSEDFFPPWSKEASKIKTDLRSARTAVTGKMARVIATHTPVGKVS